MNALPVIFATALFRGISADGTQRLAAEARLRTYRPGETVVSETDPVRAFYVVVSGQVKLYKSSAEGKSRPCISSDGGAFRSLHGLCHRILSSERNGSRRKHAPDPSRADVEEVAMRNRCCC